MASRICISRGVNLERLYDHLGQGKHIFVLKPERNIADIKMIVIAAYAFGDAAYIRRRKDEGLIRIT